MAAAGLFRHRLGQNPPMPPPKGADAIVMLN